MILWISRQIQLEPKHFWRCNCFFPTKLPIQLLRVYISICMNQKNEEKELAHFEIGPIMLPIMAYKYWFSTGYGASIHVQTHTARGGDQSFPPLSCIEHIGKVALYSFYTVYHLLVCYVPMLTMQSILLWAGLKHFNRIWMLYTRAYLLSFSWPPYNPSWLNISHLLLEPTWQNLADLIYKLFSPLVGIDMKLYFL